jgi:hypothetical protein
VFENRVLRRIFGPKRNEVTKEWRKLHNDELNYLYSSPNTGDKIEKSEMGGERDMYGGQERCVQCFSGEPEGRRPFGRTGRRWEDYIKMDRKEMAWGLGLD